MRAGQLARGEEGTKAQEAEPGLWDMDQPHPPAPGAGQGGQDPPILPEGRHGISEASCRSRTREDPSLQILEPCGPIW